MKQEEAKKISGGTSPSQARQKQVRDFKITWHQACHHS
jgi:hypothetical protein